MIIIVKEQPGVKQIICDFSVTVSLQACYNGPYIMKTILRYIKPYTGEVVFAMFVKLVGTTLELMIPYVLEYMIDEVVPLRSMQRVLLTGALMILLAIGARTVHVFANRKAVKVAKQAIYNVRRDLFMRSIGLSGSQADAIGLPSLTSRMTADSYNIQNFIRAFQTMGIRAPILLVGGIVVTLTMDAGLASILLVIAPVMIALITFISMKGIPMYEKVQQRLDDIIRVMRENITGIRVVKALSREDHEQERFAAANEAMIKTDIRAGLLMALPGPISTLFLNCGLTAVVVLGAMRVNAGVTKPGVILAFLTYFNMILMGVMALNRVFVMMSKANASANRIGEVIDIPEELTPVPESEAPDTGRKGYIVFDHVDFEYTTEDKESERDFGGGQKELVLSDIDFEIEKGGSLGIIGATGSGKSTVVSLLMRFYDTTSGNVYIGGRNVKTYKKDELHRMFGTVFQNDVIFNDTIRENIVFGRDVTEDEMKQAAEDAMAAEFIHTYEDGYDHMAQIRGANFSGGQRQRLLISRALADDPQILILDDASSALDYRTDARLRKALGAHHADATTIVIAQRVSSIMNMDHVMVIQDGKIAGYGTHDELFDNCAAYREIFMTQMGEAR